MDRILSAAAPPRTQPNALGPDWRFRRLTAHPLQPHYAPMPTQKKRTHRKPTGRLVDVARVVSVGQDRRTGEAILKFKDTKGKLVAVRLRPGQFKTLAHGVLGPAEARGCVATLG